MVRFTSGVQSNTIRFLGKTGFFGLPEVPGSTAFWDRAPSPKALICDPFLGSGTTACAVASLGQGRRFWAAEIDRETCKIARNRVAAELRSVGGSAAKLTA